MDQTDLPRRWPSVSVLLHAIAAGSAALDFLLLCHSLLLLVGCPLVCAVLLLQVAVLCFVPPWRVVAC